MLLTLRPLTALLYHNSAGKYLRHHTSLSVVSVLSSSSRNLGVIPAPLAKTCSVPLRLGVHHRYHLRTHILPPGRRVLASLAQVSVAIVNYTEHARIH